mgnify:CR=1 FL=1
MPNSRPAQERPGDARVLDCLYRVGAFVNATEDPREALDFILEVDCYAFAWRHKATRDAASRDWLHRTLDFIEGHMRHPGGLGFWHELPAKGWRQQNPHMHLTEACLAAYEATGETRFADAATKLIDLFQSKLFDQHSGTLAEYFADDWSRAPGEEGRLVEPGHQLEWAWILNAARKQLNLNTTDMIRALVKFAEAHGVDKATNVTFNSVRDDGQRAQEDQHQHEGDRDQHQQENLQNARYGTGHRAFR